ncbi:MAG TPA: dihydroorotase [Ferruginibacter sp.]|nr:dihydroorotase [Ferruginibacter sp.]HRE62963.1 dihydroorotase [Ferruginibacter sp.]
MTVLIKQATISGSSSPLQGQVKDIFITNGIISKIADSISDSADVTITDTNLYVSIGWVDSFANFADPGYEQKETLETGAASAAAGGFTDVLITPNTQPTASGKSVVEYIKQKSQDLPVNIHPIGSVSKNVEGKELSEMYDMHQSAAIAFSDGTHSIQSPGLLLKALQYVLPIGATIIQLPDDKSISSQGLMNEGIVSTQLGLPGKAAIAEELMIARDIELLRYTGSKLHITGVSTEKGIALIEEAKKQNLRVTCSVTPMHLLFCDEDLKGYDTNLKLNPPLRTASDRAALQKSFKDGLIDCIASHHSPQHWDDKTCEFEYAKNGSESLEAVYGIANLFAKGYHSLAEQMGIVPRKIFGLPLPEIKEGQEAVLTLFVPDATFTFEERMIKSKSKNNPFIGQQLKGKIVGIINKNKLTLNQ